MIEIKKYACSTCGSVFTDAEECEKHEREHGMCLCEKQPKAYVARVIMGYGKELAVWVDFKDSAIKTFIPTGCDLGLTKTRKILNCPFCGRELRGDAE